MNRVHVWSVMLAIGAGMMISAPALAQGGGGGGGGGGFGNRGGQNAQGGFDVSQIRQRMNDGIKEQLVVTDEEWAVLSPKIEKIQELQADAGQGMANLSGLTRMFAGGRGRGARTINIPGLTGGSNAMANAQQLLDEAMNNPASTQGLIKQRLDEVRRLRALAKVELAKAQAELIPLLTSRQEAVLFQMGLIE